MSTTKLAPPEHDMKPNPEEAASVIDTSKMNDGQRAALEMTEATSSGFGFISCSAGASFVVLIIQ